MEFEILPLLPLAHQQIRLGDIQASGRKWTIAIEYYIRAIEYFKAIQNNLLDSSLTSIIQVQIIQCEKTINLCRLKDQAAKVEHLTNHDDKNSFSTFIFAKKNKKHDAHKIEELQMSYEALKIHLKAAFDDIERLKYENHQLRLQQEMNMIQEENDSRLSTSNSDEEETELEATL